MQQDDDLDIILAKRAAPPPSNGLAERIIRQAVLNPRTGRRKGFWAEIGAMLVLPHPSVAVATAILLGIAVGLQASDGLSVLQQDWSSFLYINEGGWL